MPDKIVLNTPRYKGEYDLDVEEEPLSALEWRWIKKISGYLPLTIQEGLEGSDPDLYVAFAVVALYRAGRIQKTEALNVADALSDVPFDAAITFIGGTVEEKDGDEVPPAEPAETPETAPPTRNTGGSSNGTSDPLAPIPLRTGARG